MGLSKNILLTIKDYEVKLDKDIKFYEYDTINLCFSIMEYGIVVKNGVSVNKLMPIQALKAYMLIETPDNKDYAEATKIEDNKVVFNLGNRYSRFIGVGRMQIVIKDADGCRITLPEFPFEIKESINTGWDDVIDVLETEHDVIITDELGRPIETTKISEFDETDEITAQTYTMVINEEGNKKIKLDTMMESISEMIEFDAKEIDRRIDEMIEVYDDGEIEVEFPSLHNDVERIKDEVNEISESLDKIEQQTLPTYVKKIEINDFTSNKAEKTEVIALDAKVNALRNSSPSGVYETLEDLKLAHPNNDGKMYIVKSANGNDKYCYWNGTTWVEGGDYQAVELADNTVTGQKLNTDFMFKKILTSSDNLDIIIDAGTYLQISSDAPSNTPLNTSAIIEVIKANNRFIVQKFYEWQNPHNCFVRWVDSNNSVNNTTWTNILNNIDFTKLSNNFSCGGDISTGLVTDIKKSGVYNIGDLEDLPDRNGWGGCLTVEVYRSDFIKYTFTNRLTNKTYVMIYNLASPTLKNWKLLCLQPLDGKKGVCFGDSITEFGNYPDTIQSLTGASMINVGFGGTRMAYHNDANYREFSFHRVVDAVVSKDFTKMREKATILEQAGSIFNPIIDRLVNIDFSTIDFITIFYGTNDWSGDITIGDIKTEDTSTYLGALNYSIKKLLNVYPHLKVYIISPQYRSRKALNDGLNSDDNPNSNGTYLVEFADALLNSQKYLHIPVLDAYRNVGINRYNSDYYLKDGLHYKDDKYEHIGRKISNFILSN